MPPALSSRRSVPPRRPSTPPAPLGVREQVKQALDGQPIPRHLLGDHASPPALSIQFGTAYDLPVRVQSSITR